MKDRVLIIGDLSRPDTLYLPRVLSETYDVLMADTSIPLLCPSREALAFGQVIDLTDYRRYGHLIEKENLRKIFYFALEDAHQVLLNATARMQGVKTFHMEHGLRDVETSNRTIRWISRSSHQSEVISPPKKHHHLKRRLLMRLLRSRSLKALPEGLQQEVRSYLDNYDSDAIGKTLREFNGRVHFPHTYISFSPAVFEFHKSLTHPELQQVQFIGNPAFDDWVDLAPSVDGKRKLFFIDQPFVEQRLFGWTMAFKKKLIAHLNSISFRLTNEPMRVKAHPGSDMEFWKDLSTEVTLVDSHQMHNNGIYLGFGSTLLILLAAQDDSAVICLDIHPDIDFKYSEFLTKNGAIDSVTSIEALEELLQSPEKLVEEQRRHKSTFTEHWIHKADGYATERLREIVNES